MAKFNAPQYDPRMLNNIFIFFIDFIMDIKIKIGDSYFEVAESSVEYSTGVHATIYIKINITNHPEYLTHFSKLFESQKNF